MSLYPANSLFMDGYLNATGSTRARTLRMIKDAGFTVKSDRRLDDLLSQEERSQEEMPDGNPDIPAIKRADDLRRNTVY